MGTDGTAFDKLDRAELGPAKTFFRYLNAALASDLSTAQRMVFIAQAKHASAKHGRLCNSFPTEATVARETGLTTKTVERARKVLTDKGWLIQTQSGRGGSSTKANEYDLCIPGEATSIRHDVGLTAAVPEANRQDVGLQTDTVSDCKPTESLIANRHNVGTSTAASALGSVPSTADNRAVEISKTQAEVATWAGDVSQLEPPARWAPGTRLYYVAPGGTVRLARGLPRPGEAEVRIDFSDPERGAQRHLAAVKIPA